MGKNEKTPIVIDDVEYKYEDMTEEQQAIVNHCADLERKLSAARFNVDQLTVGKDAFVNMLKQSLEPELIGE
jgi:hypothetical protein|tara:strand:+ start:88 stop:303 length:216 start_codon:yes stop_codon:yes gene_type:complete